MVNSSILDRNKKHKKSGIAYRFFVGRTIFTLNLLKQQASHYLHAIRRTQKQVIWIKTSHTHSPSTKSRLNLTAVTWPQNNELKPWQASVGKAL